MTTRKLDLTETELVWLGFVVTTHIDHCPCSTSLAVMHKILSVLDPADKIGLDMLKEGYELAVRRELEYAKSILGSPTTVN